VAGTGTLRCSATTFTSSACPRRRASCGRTTGRWRASGSASTSTAATRPQGVQITSAQITDYYNHAFGLSGQHTPNSDHSWFPASIKDTIFDLKTYVAKRAKKQPPPPPPPVSKERLMADWSFYDDAMPAIDVPQIVGWRATSRATRPKDISDAERRKHHADGKWVLPVFETSANRARAGAAAGREDRLAAEAQADDLGWPVEDTVFMAVDFDATWAQGRGLLHGGERGQAPAGGRLRLGPDRGPEHRGRPGQ
jgi:hypothetical protein